MNEECRHETQTDTEPPVSNSRNHTQQTRNSSSLAVQCRRRYAIRQIRNHSSRKHRSAMYQSQTRSHWDARAAESQHPSALNPIAMKEECRHVTQADTEPPAADGDRPLQTRFAAKHTVQCRRKHATQAGNAFKIQPSDKCGQRENPGPQYAFKMSMFVSCSSHEITQFAAFFIDPRAE